MKEKSKKLKTKELIYAGAFAAIYLIAMFIVVMGLGIIPVLYLLAPMFVGLICATIYMMYVSKVKKFGAILILAVLFGLIMSSSGHGVTVLLAIPIGLLAELVAKSKGYTSKKMIVLSYAIFNLTMIAPFQLLYTATSSFVEETRVYYGDVYANTINHFITTYGSMLLVTQIIVGVVGALVGGLLATVLFKKHFEKSGLI